MTGTAVTASVETPAAIDKKGVVALLTSDQARARIEPLLPKGVGLETVVAEVQLAIINNPELAQCTPISLIASVAKVQQWGLRIGETAHLVPFNVNVASKGAPKKWEKRAQAIADYKGLAQLVRASGAVRHVEARPVYAKEHFVVEYGLNPKLEHIPQHSSTDRGPLFGAYVIFFLPFGQRSFHFMPIEDVEAIRSRYSKSWKEGPCPPWYAVKCSIRQGVKLLPKDARLAEALRVVQEDELAELAEAAELAPADGPVAALGAPPEASDETALGTAVASEEIPGAEEDQETGAPASMTLEQAKTFPFPFQKGKPVHGRPLGELSDEHLQSVAAWIVEKQREGTPAFHAETLEAIGLILGDREAQQMKLALDEPPLPAGSGGSVRMPPPGRVSDALTPSGGTPKASAA